MIEGKVVQELDVLDVIKNIGKKNKRLQAILLQEVEKLVDKDSPEFEALRKAILDETNNYTRSVIRVIFGDIEYLIN
jgi:hypothetical protein